MKNRIEEKVAKFAQAVEAKGLTPEAKKALSSSLDMNFEELALFQETKSLAQLHKVLSLEEATYIYSRLGESESVFNAQPVALKAVFTQLFTELLAWKRTLVASVPC